MVRPGPRAQGEGAAKHPGGGGEGEGGGEGRRRGRNASREDQGVERVQGEGDEEGVRRVERVEGLRGVPEGVPEGVVQGVVEGVLEPVPEGEGDPRATRGRPEGGSENGCPARDEDEPTSRLRRGARNRRRGPWGEGTATKERRDEAPRRRNARRARGGGCFFSARRPRRRREKNKPPPRRAETPHSRARGGADHGAPRRPSSTRAKTSREKTSPHPLVGASGVRCGECLRRERSVSASRRVSARTFYIHGASGVDYGTRAPLAAALFAARSSSLASRRPRGVLLP